MKVLIAPMLALSLGGCTTAAGTVAIVGLDVASEAATGRSLTGHVIHAMTGRHCETSNLLKGKAYCAPSEPDVAMAPSTPTGAHCYRSIAGVTCHPVPDVFMSDARRLGGRDAPP
jgi:hypothetical protein